MSAEELRKAVEAVKWLAGIADERAASHLAVIRNALRDQEAEIARLSEINVKLCADFNAQNLHGARLDDRVRAAEARAERAEALLRECCRFVAWASERLPEALPIYEKLDAHLSENSH